MVTSSRMNSWTGAWDYLLLVMRWRWSLKAPGYLDFVRHRNHIAEPASKLRILDLLRI